MGARNVLILEWSEKSGVSPELLGRIHAVFRKIRNLLGVRTSRDFLFIRSGVLEDRNLSGVRTLRDFSFTRSGVYSRVTLLILVIFMFGVPGYSEVPGAILYCTWPGPLAGSHVTGEPGTPDLEKFQGIGISHFSYRLYRVERNPWVLYIYLFKV